MMPLLVGGVLVLIALFRLSADSQGISDSDLRLLTLLVVLVAIATAIQGVVDWRRAEFGDDGSAQAAENDGAIAELVEDSNQLTEEVEGLLSRVEALEERSASHEGRLRPVESFLLDPDPHEGRPPIRTRTEAVDTRGNELKTPGPGVTP